MRIHVFFGNRRMLGPGLRVMRAAALGIIICLIGSSSRRTAGNRGRGLKARTLPNGLKVLVLENHQRRRWPTFNVFYKVGSRNEQMGKDGAVASMRAT